MSATAFTAPTTLPVRPDTIPPELRDGAQFVAWQWENREGKWTKPPRNARTGGMASSTDPATWTDFATAYAYASRHYAGRGGVGRVLVEGGIVWGIDLDHCRDSETGEIAAWAWGIIRALDSYTEISPSGTGVRIFLKAALPLRSGKRGDVEMYREGRYLTLTGHHLAGTPTRVEERTEAFAAFHKRVFADAGANGDAEKRIVPVSAPVADVPDSELIALALRARNGDKFAGLWAGSAAGYASQSEADIALCSLLAFYTGPDEARIDSLFRRSGLMREKWDLQRGDATYGERTIREAVASRTEYWTPGERYTGYRGEHDADASTPDAWTPPADLWPAPLDEAAFYGLAGEMVRAVEPETEADPVAILANLLAMFGNAVNRAPYSSVGADMHRINLNIITVGATAAGGKGMASNQARRFMREADPDWCVRIMGGLSSGEGLIWPIRDPITKFVYDKKTQSTDEVTVDPGVSDKRLFVLETEFAGVLRVFQRDGNTLSNIIRDAWDGKDLAAMTKNSPARATAPHISIFGHITRHELLRYLDSTEAANGLGNRFIWLCVRRSKQLPDGGADIDLAPYTRRLTEALSFARTVGRMQRDDAAREMWHSVYGPLTEGKPGMLGAMIARAAPIVVRLSMLYALLDLSNIIRAEHLRAAIALWDYAEASARWIFGDAMGDPVADEILGALRRAPGGMTRTEIRDLLGRNQKVERIERALTVLHEANLAYCERSGGGPGEGRPSERWFATQSGARK